MIDADDRLPINKPNPMRPTDWILLGIFIILLATTFPFLLWIYGPFIWALARIIVPVAILIFIGYFALRALQLGETKGASPEGDFSDNLGKAWTELTGWIRKFFKPVAITGIIVLVIFCTSALLYTKFSRKTVTEKQMARMTESLEKYKNHIGHYPAQLAELVGTDPLKREWYQDSWGNKIDYTLTKNGAGYQLTSPGADGVKGNGDDVVVSI